MKLFVLFAAALAAALGLLGTASQLDAAWAKSVGAQASEEKKVRGLHAIFWGLKQAGWLLLKALPGTGQPRVEQREHGGLVLRFGAVLITAIAVGVQQLPELAA